MAYRCTPNLDYSRPDIRERQAEAIREIERTIAAGPIEVSPIINGTVQQTRTHFYRENPADPSSRIAKISAADSETLEITLGSMEQDKAAWKNTTPQTRIKLLRKLGNAIEEDRMRLSSTMILESGKPWIEADAEVSEAVDFCHFYTQVMEERLTPFEVNIPGQLNCTAYWPKGRVAVIAPWNFPLAILCGMAVAALITGNQTIIKPAEQSSLIGFEFAKLLLKVGFPKESFAFLPGNGAEIGRALVDSPLVDMICFTGSKEVGLEIIQRAAAVHPGQRTIKRVVAEMGGKNAIIIDSDADLDAAIPGVLRSAFGFSGQKCSACSRVIVVEAMYERFIKRLKEAAKSVVSGPTSHPATVVGPVIDNASKERVLSLIEREKATVPILFQGEAPSEGHFVPVTIFYDVPFTSPIWQDELFAPVLAVASVATFQEAIRVASDSEYALTGSVYSRHPGNIELARETLEVGNLYINQGSTGALVGRQPFGGFKLSGCGLKAGGWNYLFQFTTERTVTENTIRKGYAPELVA